MKLVLPAKKNVLTVLTTVGILTVVISPTAYFYDQYKSVQKIALGSNNLAKEENKILVEKIARVIQLPQNDIPTIATVTDKTKLKSTPFFASVENGDKVLIFSESKKAILYRPSTNKIIDMSSVNLGAENKTTQPTNTIGAQPANTADTKPTETKTQNPLKVVLLNGTSVKGLTTKVEDKLVSAKLDYTVTNRDNAKTNTYENTTVVALGTTSKTVVDEIAKLLNAKVETMPQGEAAITEGDVLIIAGKNLTK